MSWNKNTVNASQIDSTIAVLKDTDTSYVLEVLGTVNGDGLNDDYDGTGVYECRKLTYGNHVLMEHMIRAYDCDADDYFVSEKFEKGNEPATDKWKLQYYQHESDFCDGSIDGCSCRS